MPRVFPPTKRAGRLRVLQAYLGVLVDDLCTLGTKRAVSHVYLRAEYRLMLREDSADLRLTEMGRRGWVWWMMNAGRFGEAGSIERERRRLAKSTWVTPSAESADEVNAHLTTRPSLP